MPGPVLAYTREVIAKGALYYSAVSQKDSAEFRATITRREGFMIIVGPSMAASPTDSEWTSLSTRRAKRNLANPRARGVSGN